MKQWWCFTQLDEISMLGALSANLLGGTCVPMRANVMVSHIRMRKSTYGDIQIGERFGKVTVRKGKHSGFREIPLTKDLRHILNVYLEEHPRKEDSDAAL